MKKSLKIFLILVLAVLMSLSLVACGSGNKNNSTGTSQSQEGEEQPENSYRINVGEVQNGSVSIFAGGAQKESGSYVVSGVSVTIEMNANNDYVAKSLVISELGVNQTYNAKTASYNFTMPSKDVNVVVTFGAPSTTTYNVGVTNPTGGTVKADKSVAAQGETVTLSNTPNTGYKFVSYVINGKSQTSNTFTMPSGNVTVTANFTQIEYSITVTKPTGGTITASKTTKVHYGDTITLSNIPDGSYTFKHYIVDGSTQTANTFKMPAKNVTVSGVFEENTYSVNITSGSNGSVTASSSKVGVGKTVTLTITPAANYMLTSLKVDGTECVSSVKNNSYSFTMPAKNVTVTYAFVRVYNVSVSTATNGKVTVSATSVKYNETVTVTATPNSGYACSGITLKVGNTTTNLDMNGNTATFTMPSQDVVVSATFRVKSSREYVSHMLLGDSYTDTTDFYHDFYSDFGGMPAAKNIGISGTTVTQWIDGLEGSFMHWEVNRETKITEKYDVDNFIFHIGVNDIDGGVAKDTVVANLKTMFTNYHTKYPNAKIYWISLSLNTMFAVDHTNDYIYVNNQMKSYIAGVDYLEYIDTCSVMFPDNQPVADWFLDGLHFNTDGYNTWGALILNAVGYPKSVVGKFGKAGNYYSSATFKANSDGSVSNTTDKRGEQSLWFNGVYAQNAYAEMSVTVKEIKNSDKYPKFGMAIKTATNHVFFWIDAAGLTGTGVGITYRTPVTLDGGYQASNDWNWSVPLNGSITSSYKDNSYVKLGLLKSGSDLFFYVDDVLVNSISVLDGVDGAAAIGFTVFNLDVTIKNCSVTTDISSKLSSLDSAAKVRMESGSGYTINGNSVTNTTAGGESSAWVSGLNHSKFYFETEMTLNSVIGTDQYPKAGLTVNLAGTGTLLFYIDALNTADVSLGTNAWVGIVYRPNGGEWQWDYQSISYVRGLQYTNGTYAKLGLYKNGSKFIFTVNGTAILETNQYTGFSGNVNVGIMAFNLAFNAKNCSVVLSDTTLDRMMTARKMTDDINVDGNITEWGTHSANSYSAYSTDGRGFKVYAFMGKNAIYVAYEIKSNTYVTDASSWYENTNVEMRITNGGGPEQLFASVNGQVRSVKSFAFKSTTSGSLKVTTVELAISYDATVTASSTQQSVSMGFACRPGNETGTGLCEGNDNVWWCGANHPDKLLTSFNSTGII